MSDLRNIVDRLDLLMGSSSEASSGPDRGIQTSAREQIEEALSELSHRVGVVERETEELRTLVNHLMTIATWQAKVTATLVGEEAEEEGPPAPDHEDDELGPAEQQLYSPPPSAPPPTPPDQHSFVDRVGKHMEPRGDEQERPRRQSSSLDDDIDDILGTNREPSSEVGPPPDFGI